MKLPRLIGTDIDGVWTDGGMYYDNEGNELKRFSTFDGMGVALCRAVAIPIVIMTGENTQIVTRRAKKLKIEMVFQGIQDKVDCMTKLTSKLGIRMDEVAYIGDDLNDLRLLKTVGYSACPSNASQLIRDEVDVVLPRAGGDGAFRAFVEHLLQTSGELNRAVESIVQGSLDGT